MATGSQLSRLGITNTTVQDVRITPVKPPAKLVEAFPESGQAFAEFNARLLELQRQFNSLAENYRLLKQPETTAVVTEPTVTVVAGPKGDKGDKGDAGSQGATGATGATENLDNLFENILTDGSDVLVGSDGNVLTGSL